MKLYYGPGSCSLSPHIVLCEAGYKFELEKVDFKTKTTEKGVDYNKISDKSAVPLLELDNGERISEGAVIVQYLADQKPEAGLAPKNGTMERVRLQEWLNYIGTEIHKGFFPIFRPMGEEAKQFAKTNLGNKFNYLSAKLKGKDYLMGKQFTVADAYLFTVLNWTFRVGIDLGQWPVLSEYHKRVAARPKVKEAMKAEGLLDKKAA